MASNVIKDIIYQNDIMCLLLVHVLATVRASYIIILMVPTKLFSDLCI